MKKTNNPVMVLSASQKPITNPCRREFAKMLQKRQSQPLNSGLYKLKEALYFIDALEAEIILLRHLQKLGEPLRGLRTYGDHAQWIKNVPKFIAEEFGWKVLPAIKVLEADGVNKLKLQKHLPNIEDRISNLISECDVVFENIQGPIAIEYSRWKMGFSALDDLFYLAKTIIQASINLTLSSRSMGLANINESSPGKPPYLGI